MDDPTGGTWLSNPFDDDKLHEECGIYGVFGIDDAANYVALGLHALQHRGQEAAGVVSYTAADGFNTVRRIGQVREALPGIHKPSKTLIKSNQEWKQRHQRNQYGAIPRTL